MKRGRGPLNEKTALAALVLLVLAWIFSGFGFGDIKIWGNYLNVGITAPDR
jgi:hypothetical protein